jgi:glycosyltransferase involved in cell wall biosynthesis
MRIFIYNPNSFGGNFEYARKLHEHYSQSSDLESILIIPENLNSEQSLTTILLPDVVKGGLLKKKLHFIRRSYVNPKRFFNYLKKVKGSGVVLFNDFEQLTAPIWVPWFNELKVKFKFGVILHDPDRTNYPPHPRYSAYCMRKLLGLMDFVMYHDHLPDLLYYRNFKGLKITVPHGLYPLAPQEQSFYQQITAWKDGAYTMGIIGNIREEKNYALAIQSLKELPGIKLVIAGKPASSSVSVPRYKKLASDLDVGDRIFWHTEYLSDGELSAVMEATDLPLLYYSKSFTSQSGVVNLLASAKKNVLISRTESGLSKLAEKYGFGVLAEPDDLKALIAGIIEAKERDYHQDEWNDYLSYADWNRHVDILKETVQKLNKHETVAG